MTELPGNPTAAMAAAVIETFENLAFMEPEQVQDGRPVFGEAAICYRLAIESPIAGWMCLAMEPTLAATIAGTVWSGDPAEVGEQLCRDTVAEILNTVAGRFMKEYIPGDQTFALGLPEPQPSVVADAAGWQTFAFSLEGEMFMILLQVA